MSAATQGNQLKANWPHTSHSSISPPRPHLSQELSPDFAHMPPIMSPAMLSAQLPDTAEKTLQKWRTLGVGPEWSKEEGTGKIYYLRANVIDWLTRNSCATTESKKPGAVTPGQNTNL